MAGACAFQTGRMVIPASRPETGGLAAREAAVAAGHAARAAAAANVRIELAADVSRLTAVSRFLAGVWLTPKAQPPLGTDVLRAIVHGGGAVHIALNDSGVAGACAAIFRPPATRGTYSLIAAAESSDRGVGFTLKQAQRAWALEHGAVSMMWTFDPLVSRNARFNLVKLGAVGTGYAVDFYGPLDDGIDGQDETDRMTAFWSLTGPRAAAAAAGRYAEVTGPDLGQAKLEPRRAPDGGPFAARDETARWCRVPADIVAIRRGGEPASAWWRAAVREVLLQAFADGFAATGMSRDGWYRLTREEPL
jgi:predicted GNAT superfamily acetyltransferase